MILLGPLFSGLEKAAPEAAWFPDRQRLRRSGFRRSMAAGRNIAVSRGRAPFAASRIMRNPAAMQNRTTERTNRSRLEGRLAAVSKAARRILLLVLLPVCLSAAPTAAEDRPDTPENRVAAAKTYLELVPVERMAENVARNIMLIIPEEKRELFRKGVSEGLTEAGIEDIMVKIVAKHFSTSEIDAMTAFYGSPEGRAIERKLPGYTADISLHVIPIIRQSVTEVMEKHFE